MIKLGIVLCFPVLVVEIPGVRDDICTGYPTIASEQVYIFSIHGYVDDVCLLLVPTRLLKSFEKRFAKLICISTFCSELVGQ